MMKEVIFNEFSMNGFLYFMKMRDKSYLLIF